MEKNILKRFRSIGFSEGISYLVLLFIAMPLKYIWMFPLAVKIVGMIHGILFMLYLGLLYKAHTTYKWNWKFSALLFLASLVPFGTFYTDKKLKLIEEFELVTYE